MNNRKDVMRPTLENDSFVDKAIATIGICLWDRFDGGITNAVQLLVRPLDVRGDESGAHPGESFVMVTITREEMRGLLAELESDWVVVVKHAGDPNEGSNAAELEQLFYLQDSRGYVGNDVLWWDKEGNGYTTDLSQAKTYSQAEAQAKHDMRETDIPWPKAYIDGKTRPAVDMQYIKREEALAGSGILLEQPKKLKKRAIRCYRCGRFMSEQQLWAGACPGCGTDNRP